MTMSDYVDGSGNASGGCDEDGSGYGLDSGDGYASGGGSPAWGTSWPRSPDVYGVIMMTERTNGYGDTAGSGYGYGESRGER